MIGSFKDDTFEQYDIKCDKCGELVCEDGQWKYPYHTRNVIHRGAPIKGKAAGCDYEVEWNDEEPEFWCKECAGALWDDTKKTMKHHIGAGVLKITNIKFDKNGKVISS